MERQQRGGQDDDVRFEVVGPGGKRDVDSVVLGERDQRGGQDDDVRFEVGPGGK